MDTSFYLPVELWLKIAESLPPDDAFHLARSSKAMWHICDSLITTHRNLASKYRFFCAEPITHTLVNLLDDLLDMPQVADYVLEFELDVNENLYYPRYDPNVSWDSLVRQSRTKPPSSQVDRYMKAVHDSGFLDTPVTQDPENYLCYVWNAQLRIGTDEAYFEKLRWTIQNGSMEPLFAIILSRLHAVRTLRIISCSHGFWFLHRCLA